MAQQQEPEVSTMSIFAPMIIGAIVMVICFNMEFHIGTVGGLIAVIWGLMNARQYAQRWPIVDGILELITGFFGSIWPPIIVGGIIGWISFANEWWIGVVIGVFLVIVGGRNLLGAITGVVADGIESVGEAVVGGVGKAIDDHKKSTKQVGQNNGTKKK